MNDLPVSSFWTTMDRGFAPRDGQAIAHNPFYVGLARGLTEVEAAHCLLGSGDHRETLDESAVPWKFRREHRRKAPSCRRALPLRLPVAPAERGHRRRHDAWRRQVSIHVS